LLLNILVGEGGIAVIAGVQSASGAFVVLRSCGGPAEVEKHIEVRSACRQNGIESGLGALVMAESGKRAANSEGQCRIAAGLFL
jgi:hypothetical protein